MSDSLLIEVLIAAVLAAIVWVVLSGVALVGLVALVVLALCGVTLLVDRRRARVVPRLHPRMRRRLR